MTENKKTIIIHDLKPLEDIGQILIKYALDPVKGLQIELEAMNFKEEDSLLVGLIGVNIQYHKTKSNGSKYLEDITISINNKDDKSRLDEVNYLSKGRPMVIDCNLPVGIRGNEVERLDVRDFKVFLTLAINTSTIGGYRYFSIISSSI